MKINKWSVNENNLINFVSWRYLTTKNFAITISKQVSAIISTYNNYYNGKNKKFINRKLDFPNIRTYIKSIKKKPGRIDHKRKTPIDNKLLLKIVSIIPNTYDGLAIKTVFMFAKFFGLRISDYAYVKKNSKYLIWDNIKIFFMKNKFYIKFITNFGKHNQYGKIEILVWKCTCDILSPKICLICHMRTYKIWSKKLLKRHHLPNDPVFRWSHLGLISSKTINSYLSFYLKKLNLQPSKYLSPHSFRHGCITDLVRAGIPRWIIKKFARHSPNSIMTFYYTQTSANEECDMMFVKLCSFYN